MCIQHSARFVVWLPKSCLAFPTSLLSTVWISCSIFSFTLVGVSPPCRASVSIAGSSARVSLHKTSCSPKTSVMMQSDVQPDGVSDTKEIWNLAPFPADYRMGIVAYGKLLICYRYDLYAPSPDNGSWIYVGRLPHGGDSLTLKTLSTGELVAIISVNMFLQVKLLSVKGVLHTYMHPCQMF